jgi:hypothetical protein
VRAIDPAASADAPTRPSDVPALAVTAKPLATDPGRFWRTPVLSPDFFGDVNVPQAAEAALKQLGRLPFWRGEIPLEAALAPVYRAAVEHGLEYFVGPDDVEDDAGD